MAAELLEAAADGMAQTKCAECGSTKHVLDPHTYQSICAECGAVIEVTFFQSSAKGASGGLEKQGQVVDMKKQRIHEMGGQLPALFVSNNAAKLERKAEGRIKWIAQQLDDDQSKLTNAVTNALRIWKLCYEKGMTAGYKGQQFAGILLYMACRQMRPEPLPYLLIDFASILEINVYKLAKMFGKLCRDIPIEIDSLTDPSIYISRFVNMLEFGDETENVTFTACKLVDQMKNDWIATGRRPSGICGAAILIAAKMHGFKRTLDEIVSVVNLTKKTISQRVKEFLETRIAGMSVDEFRKFNRRDIQQQVNKEEQELPPIMRKEERKKLKLQKEENIKMKIKEKIDKFDEEFDAKHGIDRSESVFSFKSKTEIVHKKEEPDTLLDESQDSDENDEFDAIFKVGNTVFVAATEGDDSHINNAQNTQRDETDEKMNGIQAPQKRKSDKQEMDASMSDNEHKMDNSLDTGTVEEAKVNELSNNTLMMGDMMRSVCTENNFQFDTSTTGLSSHTECPFGSQSESGWDGSEVSSTTPYSDVNSAADGQTFIVGANATQLPYEMEYDDERGAVDTVNDEESKIKKYWEEHDLSHLDDDPSVRAMLLDNEEIKAKSMMFDICNPDWKKVKKDMDRRSMIKEEKEEKRRKRKLEEGYSMDPHEYIAGRVNKRFRSARTDPEAFAKLTGQLPVEPLVAPSPTVSIKQMKEDSVQRSNCN